jgi:hypothetical protein
VLVIIGTKMLAHGHLKEWLGAVPGRPDPGLSVHVQRIGTS